jgi:hypothetical protein
MEEMEKRGREKEKRRDEKEVVKKTMEGRITTK